MVSPQIMWLSTQKPLRKKNALLEGLQEGEEDAYLSSRETLNITFLAREVIFTIPHVGD
jgi:hypothetical protein